VNWDGSEVVRTTIGMGESGGRIYLGRAYLGFHTGETRKAN
jgi:hypothetical protein